MENWIKVASEADIPEGLGGCVKLEDKQIAVFHYASNEWYALDNCCPHKKHNVMSRGLLGDKAGEPKVACPMHKNQFSLKTGACLSGLDLEIPTYPIKIEAGQIFLSLESTLAS